jgi:carboxypeptidase Q
MFRVPAAIILVFLCHAPTDADQPLSRAQAATKLIDAALADDEGYAKLTWLCDRIGPRLAGSAGLESAVKWAADQMRRDGLVNVQTLPVAVPHWVRGRESLRVVGPFERDLPLLGLGDSVGTPPEGITAELVVVGSFDELEQLGRARVAGKIVLYDVPFTSYGKTVQYRTSGASRAARLGAVAALVRSVTPTSLRTPHTGQMDYDAGVPRIPAAAVTVEDAMMFHRLATSGATVRVHLTMGAQMLPDAQSANVIGEIPGREKPEEIVLMGGHLDSWDVGQGAHDDGAGVVACMHAAALIRKLGLQPRRTIRVVAFTNEENGTRGAAGYKAWAGDSVSRHFAAIEMDGGAEKPLGFGVGPKLYDRALEIGKLLERIGAGTIFGGGGGADISPLVRAGVTGISHRTVGTHYFDWHHTPADTLDKVDPQDFRLNVAAMAVMAYCLADLPDDSERGTR